ncbi:hypothetical protein LCY76_09490 [Fictibacillus sp. KIGAM418]|uniref:Uncharacterized protein n=1 Tax=Fictibacillus marinisediminis TaxID=2878389 RepID=A0A9X2BCR7_9BACL|nr:hypothetical protein [Fictibacillus marinisediminis]MCK6256826.1 hypothetical protein [Fictibacillus marinisediminis]
MTINVQVQNYIFVMRNLQDSINQLQGEQYLENHKKTLLFSLLETLSKGVFGTERNFVKFERLIREFCVWEDGKRVSLQQLSLLLERTEERGFETLKSYVEANLSRYPMSRPVPFTHDPYIEEIREYMPEGIQKINGVKLEQLTHVSLLWKYRNGLVHEARGLGANELFDEVEPHYIFYRAIGYDTEGEIAYKKYWQKLYPLHFLNDLINQVITNIEPYLIQNGIDPYDNYNFEPLWIEGRN